MAEEHSEKAEEEYDEELERELINTVKDLLYTRRFQKIRLDKIDEKLLKIEKMSPEDLAKAGGKDVFLHDSGGNRL